MAASNHAFAVENSQFSFEPTKQSSMNYKSRTANFNRANGTNKITFVVKDRNTEGIEDRTSTQNAAVQSGPTSEISAISIGSTGWQPENSLVVFAMSELSIVVQNKGCSEEVREKFLTDISQTGQVEIDLSPTSEDVQNCIFNEDK